MNLMAFSFGGPEVIVIGIIALLLFGRRLPMVARNLGSSFNQFKAGLRDNTSHDDENNQLFDDKDKSEKKEEDNNNDKQNT